MGKFHRLIIAAICFLSPALAAQEALNSMESRGYVAQWLVCGPFPSDVEGGIIAAIQEGRPPLGDTDFMMPIGGIARTQPKHRLQVDHNGQRAIWQKTRSEDGTLDLSPFFPQAPEGVAYAAFYVQTPVAKAAYFELESTLGARVYFNGHIIRPFPTAPVEVSGQDSFLLRFRAGTNLLVFELPGVSLNALATATGTSVEQIKSTTLSSRSSLPKKTGFEFAMRVHPIKEMSNLAYVPYLQSLGSFSGQGANIKQNLALVLHNPHTQISSPIRITARAQGDSADTTTVVQPIPPGQTARAYLPVTTARKPAGSPRQVTVRIEHNEDSAEFLTAFNVAAPSPSGRAYVLTGAKEQSVTPQTEATTGHTRALRRRLQIESSRSDYGFLLGDFESWYPAWLQMPGKQQNINRLVSGGQAAPAMGHAYLDEQTAGGELLIRNLLYGHHAQLSYFGRWNPVQLAWNTTGFNSQSPQILRRSGAIGVIHNLSVTGLESIYRQTAPDGTSIIHRKKNQGPIPQSIRELTGITDRQRRESLAMGLNADVFVDDHPEMAPAPFWLADPEPLSGAHPQLEVRGSGGEDYFQTLTNDLKWVNEELTTTSRPLIAENAPTPTGYPTLTTTQARIEHRLLAAEKWSALAQRYGLEYPTESLDAAWRQLLYHNNAPAVNHADARTNLRQAGLHALDAGNRARNALAQQINTYSNAPVDNNPDATALVVFNPLNWSRTEPVFADVTLQNGRGLSIVDESGTPVAYYADRRLVRNRLLARVRLQFVAENVPSMGYKTYYILPTGVLPELEEQPEPFKIENEFLTVSFDDNQQIRIGDRESDTELYTGPWNAVVAHEKGDGIPKFANFPDAESATIEVVTLDLMQRATITRPLLSGTLVQQYTLYSGIDTLHISTQFQGDAQGKSLSIRFPEATKDRALYTGSHFSETLSRNKSVSVKNKHAENKQETSPKIVSSYQHFSTRPHTQIFAEPRNIPLLPSIIEPGSGPSHLPWANRFVVELTRMGRSAHVKDVAANQKSALWTDASPYDTPMDPYLDGNTLRILIGNAEQNPSTKNLFEQIPEPKALDIQSAITKAEPYFFLDDYSIEGVSIPTLLLAGDTTSQTDQALKRFLAMLQEDTVPQNLSNGAPSKLSGLTILHEGPVWVTQTDDDLTVLLHESSEGLEDPTYVRLDYALKIQRPHTNAADNLKSGLAWNAPLEAHQTDLHLGPLAPSGSFITTRPANFLLTALKPATDTWGQLTRPDAPPSGQWTLRGFNASRYPQHTEILFNSAIRSAMSASMLEIPQEKMDLSANKLSFEADPWGIHTMRVRPAIISSPPRLATEQEPPIPLHAAYWTHHAGAAHTASFRAHLTINGDLAQEEQSKTLTITNLDAENALTGSVSVIPSAGWHVSPSLHDYDLPPGGYQQIPLTVISTSGQNDHGGILAQTTVDGVTVQAVLSLDEAPISIQTTQNRDEIRVNITNNGGLPMAATVQVATHPEYWGELNPDYSTEVHPHARRTQIAPYGKEQVIFRFTGMPPASPVTIKVTGNGSIAYDTITLTDN